MAVKTVKLFCEVCKTDFDRYLSEHKRNLSKNRTLSFCSNKCSAIYRNRREDIRLASSERLTNYNIVYKPCKKTNYLSPFRILYNSAKTHAKNRNREFNITIDHLFEVWEKQNGLCPYTGWKLQVGLNSGSQVKLCPSKASLDRIDSSKGYTRDNIQIISYMANMAKNKFSEEEFISFCKAVAEYHK